MLKKLERGVLLEPPAEQILAMVDQVEGRIHLDGIHNLLELINDELKLYDGIFHHYFDLELDEFNEVMNFRYIIEIKNVMAKLIIYEEEMDTLKISGSFGSITIDALYVHLDVMFEKVRRNVIEFNQFILTRPIFPERIPKEDMADPLLGCARELISEIDEMNPYRCIIGAYDTIKEYYLSESVRVNYNTFYNLQIGWSNMRLEVEFKELSTKFLLHEYSVSLDKMVFGADIPDVFRMDLLTMETALRSWNKFINPEQSKKTIKRKGVNIAR